MSHCCVDQLGENALCTCGPGNILRLLTSLHELLEFAVPLILRKLFEGAYVLLRDVVGLAEAPLEGAETACVLGGVESCRSQVERDLRVLLWTGRLDGCGRHLDILDCGFDNAMCPAFLLRGKGELNTDRVAEVVHGLGRHGFAAIRDQHLRARFVGEPTFGEGLDEHLLHERADYSQLGGQVDEQGELYLARYSGNIPLADIQTDCLPSLV